MILDHYVADLSDLIALCLVSLGLQVQNLHHTVLGEDVVITSDALSEAQVPQQMAQFREPDVRIRITP